MERKLLEAMSREEPLSLPAADSSPTEGSLWQAGQANLDEEGLMGRQMPGSATEDGESLAGVLDSEPAIGEKEISEAMAVLEKYKSAKASLDKRIIDNEEWYKLGHWKQYGNRVMEGKRAPSTGWLFNSIANKHADAMDNYPEPNVLPRAQDDEETAKLLSDILPVVLEQADYESVYSDTWWRKLKQGTGVKGIFWDPALREGLGDDAYYEDMAMKKGISVQLAKEMDALESENAKHRAAEQQRAEAAKMEAIQQEWDAAAERIRAEDPGFDIKMALADPDFAQMLKLGVKMEDAYKARYFDDIMARRTTQTAKTVEKGVEARIRQRGARPSENGTNPGGAAVLKTDVSKLTPQQCEELERRAMRGQIITF